MLKRIPHGISLYKMDVPTFLVYLVARFIAENHYAAMYAYACSKVHTPQTISKTYLLDSETYHATQVASFKP